MSNNNTQSVSDKLIAHFCKDNIDEYVRNLTKTYTDTSNEASMVSASVIMFVLAGLFFNLNLFSRFSDVSAILDPKVLSPGHITFTVVHSSSTNASSSSINGTGDSQYLNLTITALNESKRCAMAVRYQSVFVDLKNSSSPNGRDTIHAQLYAEPDPEKYFPEAAANIKASVLLVGSQDFAGDRASSGGFTVVITALVKFRVWKIPTRQYDIKVSCPRVLFPEQQGPMSSPKLAVAVQQPVNCTG